MKRKIPLVTGKVYHVFNKSIADFVVFNNDDEFSRMRDLFRYYQIKDPPYRFNYFVKIKIKENFDENLPSYLSGKEKIVQNIKEDVIDISPSSYKNFVESRISYQKEIEKIKHLILE